MKCVYLWCKAEADRYSNYCPKHRKLINSTVLRKLAKKTVKKAKRK